MSYNIEEYLFKVGVPQKYLSACLDGEKYEEVFGTGMEPRQKDIYKKSTKVVEDKKYGLFLSGSNGAGKSYLACALLKYCKAELNLSVARTTVQDVLDWFFNEYQGYRKRWLCADVLLIEELGREINFKNEQKIRIIENLVKLREEEGKIIIFTTNYEMIKLKEIYSEYLYNLISGTCVAFTFPMIDLRNEKLGMYIKKLC